MMFTEHEWNELLEKNQQLEKEKKKLQQTVLDFQSRYNESLEEIKRYREALEYALPLAEHLMQPDKPLHEGLDPTFYFTLSYEGDLKEINKLKRAREALKGDNNG